MTRQEAVEWFKLMQEKFENTKYADALNMAIKALEQEPSEDCISRQAAIDGVKTLHDVAWKNWHEPTLSANVVLDMIKELPSAQLFTAEAYELGRADRPKGHWIDTEFLKLKECLCCHCRWGMYDVEDFDFCPNCGADMRGDTE